MSTLIAIHTYLNCLANFNWGRRIKVNRVEFKHRGYNLSVVQVSKFHFIRWSKSRCIKIQRVEDTSNNSWLFHWTSTQQRKQLVHSLNDNATIKTAGSVFNRPNENNWFIHWIIALTFFIQCKFKRQLKQRVQYWTTIQRWKQRVQAMN